MEVLTNLVYSIKGALEKQKVLDIGRIENQELQLSKICNGTNAFIAIHDITNLRLAYVNDACKDFYGLYQNLSLNLDSSFYISKFHPRNLDLLLKSYNFFYVNNGEGDLKLLYRLKDQTGNYQDILGHTITVKRKNGKPSIACSVMYYAEKLNEVKLSVPSKSPLSKRETQVLRLIYDNKDKHKIAEELFISVDTVMTHKKNIMKKLGVHSTVSLIKMANGILNSTVDS